MTATRITFFAQHTIDLFVARFAAGGVATHVEWHEGYGLLVTDGQSVLVTVGDDGTYCFWEYPEGYSPCDDIKTFAARRPEWVAVLRRTAAAYEVAYLRQSIEQMTDAAIRWRVLELSTATPEAEPDKDHDAWAAAALRTPQDRQRKALAALADPGPLGRWARRVARRRTRIWGDVLLPGTRIAIAGAGPGWRDLGPQTALRTLQA